MRDDVVQTGDHVTDPFPILAGAELRTFLLEKSRVTSVTGEGERSYHIFYQLLAGSQSAQGEGIGSSRFP